MDAAALTERLAAALLRDRLFVLGLPPLAAVTRQVAMLRGHGAPRPSRRPHPEQTRARDLP